MTAGDCRVRQNTAPLDWSRAGHFVSKNGKAAPQGAATMKTTNGVNVVPRRRLST